ncbi:MAG: hypothetical protein ACYC5G_04495 [Candidatus Doudnabacteria bacterium]
MQIQFLNDRLFFKEMDIEKNMAPKINIVREIKATMIIVNSGEDLIENIEYIPALSPSSISMIDNITLPSFWSGV